MLQAPRMLFLMFIEMFVSFSVSVNETESMVKAGDRDSRYSVKTYRNNFCLYFLFQ